MGAKTALLAFADVGIDIREALRDVTTTSTRDAAEAVVRRVHPGYVIEPVEESTLDDHVNPPDDLTYAAALAGAELFCDGRLVLDRPSELPRHLLALGAGRRIVMHGMHSVVDWLCFAVWEDGRLIRSLSLSPRSGVIENIGEWYEFERPFWAGEHPVVPEPGWPNQRPYPLPFHPLELGEEALRALFGFTIEGRRGEGDIDPTEVPVHGFRVTDPTGAEQAEREAIYAAIRAQLRRGTGD